MSVINTNITAMIGQQNLTKSQNALSTSMDGISVAQTAEGALNQVNDNLQRIRELSVQASNDTNSSEDRASIQAEIKQRLTEIDRISEQTDFNGVKVLGKDQSLSIQVGANDGEAIDVNLKEVTASKLNLGSFNVSGPADTDPDATGVQGLVTQEGSTTDAMKEAYGETTGVAESSADTLAGRLGVATTSIVVGSDAVVDDAGNWYASVNIKGADTGEINALAANGIEVPSDNSSATFYVALEPSEASLSATTATFNIDTGRMSLSSLTTGATSNPMEQLDSALKQVDELRSDLGAIQNRFESAITNLQTNETNLSAARSRIEVSNMTRAQILQQAGTSVLAQANQVPQNVLSLLG